MSAVGDKKATSKDDLRRLMEAQKLSSRTLKIDSPLARYNSLGQLSCVVCNCPLKSEALWKAHILKKEHKTNVERYKVQTAQKPVDSSVTSSHPCLKRKSIDSSITQGNAKIPKLQAGDTASSGSGGERRTELNHTATKSLPTYESSSDESDMEVGVSNAQQSTPLPVASSGSTTAVSSQSNEPSTVANRNEPFPTNLPEGFIDDPVLDAKVRNVPYKDKMEEQLELFQKEIKQEETVSAALLDDDDEQREKEREIYATEELMHNYSKVIQLANLKKNDTESTNRQKPNVSDMEEGSDDDDEEDDFSNFRIKRRV